MASAMIAAVGNATAISSVRDMAAWLELVPRQHTTGGKPKLGSITKRGNVQLRTLVVQGANSLMIHMDRESTAIGKWLGQLEKRAHRHVADIVPWRTRSSAYVGNYCLLARLPPLAKLRPAGVEVRSNNPHQELRALRA